MSKVAAAIFVRTPGWSASKCRLSREIAADQTAQIYARSLDCMIELAKQLADVDVAVRWAVAEAEAVDQPFWRQTGLPAMASGTGSLGCRLANVYAQLLEEADVAVLLGSDSPQLAVADLEPAWLEPRAERFVVGPSCDGGFYMFAGSKPIEAEVWRGVEYSQPTTLAQLEQALDEPVARLAAQPDFDNLESLAQVLEAMPAKLSEGQREFAEYCSGLEVQADAQELEFTPARNIL